MVTIYALIDPETMEEKYIGKTSRPLIKRVAQHISAKDLTNGMKAYWIIQLKKKGYIPLFKELEVVSNDEGTVAENKWIKHFEEKGNYLFNIVQLSDSINLYNKPKEAPPRKIYTNPCQRKNLIRRHGFKIKPPLTAKQRRDKIFYFYQVRHNKEQVEKWREKNKYPKWFQNIERIINKVKPYSPPCNTCYEPLIRIIS